MPETTVTSTQPPQVDADVENGGGGPPSHVAGAYITWDPAYLEGSNPNYSNYAYLDQANGFCVWYGQVIRSGRTKTFSLDLPRIAHGVTWVLACSMDPKTEAFSNPKSWRVPANHPFVTVSTGTKKKTSKKKKKKTSKKTRRRA